LTFSLPCFILLPMSDEYQILIPPSFMALFLAPGQVKPNEPRNHIAQRYEWCEDMAQMLAEPAREQMFRLGITESDAVRSIQKGLSGPDAVVSEPEAEWVAARLRELLLSGG